MLTVEEILKSTGGRLLGQAGQLSITGISTDSRQIKKGDLFVPLKGESFDGHRFIKDALSKGAAGALIEGDHLSEFSPPPSSSFLIIVSDTLFAFQEMARYYRNKFDIPVVGITGSNGKTTTKEMVWQIMSRRHSVLRNEGNLNNHIGVPLTLFRLEPVHDLAVVEMGISDKGELTRLCQLANPSSAVITNIGPTHLEKLGRIENVAEAKSEILKFIDRDGACILNRDDTFFDVFKAMSHGRVLSFGMSSKADIYTEAVDMAPNRKSIELMSFRLFCPLGETEIKMQVIGLHNLYNALCAAATAVALGANIEDIKSGLEAFSPVTMRSVVENVKGIYIINDTYNANPASMVAAIDTLKSLKEGKQKFVILGDMLELGENSVAAHRDLGIYIASAELDGLIAVGEFSDYVADGAISAGMSEKKILTYRDYTQTLEQVRQWLNKGDMLLVKGSRGMKMERIVECLKESLQ